jgi:hypothetical protein
MFQQLFTGAFIFFNFGALIVGALLSFLLTSWRARLTWFDWTIALLLNLPVALLLKNFLTEQIEGRCSVFCLVVMFGGAGFGIGLLFGLLCSKWVIAGSPDPETQN